MSVLAQAVIPLPLVDLESRLYVLEELVDFADGLIAWSMFIITDFDAHPEPYGAS